MRVIAGEFKGRTLKIPKGLKVRPTSQKVKEALFSLLGEKIRSASFLELFAGSGSVGIEAASRGAAQVYLVENNRLCVRTIAENLRQLKIRYNYGLRPERAQRQPKIALLAVAAARAIQELYRKGKKFDFIFLDPPYHQEDLKNALIKICHYDILNARSYVIAEHSRGEALPQGLCGLKLIFTKRYGDTALSLYQKEGKR